MRKDDLVTAVEGEKVTDGIALIVAIRAHRPGDTVHFSVRRGAAHERTSGSPSAPRSAESSAGPPSAGPPSAKGWVVDEGPGLVVHPSDVVLELVGLDPPLPAATDLDRR